MLRINIARFLVWLGLTMLPGRETWLRRETEVLSDNMGRRAHTILVKGKHWEVGDDE